MDDSPALPSPEDMSHALLLALLMERGGSAVLPARALDVDAIGTPDGSFHAIRLEALPDDLLRVSVHPRPDEDGAGIRIQH
ncbi:pRL2-19 [Streptomyces liangshanensis]|uniref:pRL2-19 n=1 Tax=Streptomyces liangshanensis TaxID=2717324 RepID=UPI0036D81BF0